MNPQEEIALIEEIIQEILGAIEQATQSGEELPDELQGMIAQELDWAANRIVELQQENPVEGLKVPELQQSMPSSTIHSFGYDPKNQKLLVKFNGKDQRDSGEVYGYSGVPQQIFDLFRKGSIPARTNGQNRWGKWWRGKVPSIGASMYTLIKNGNYPYERIS